MVAIDDDFPAGIKVGLAGEPGLLPWRYRLPPDVQSLPDPLSPPFSLTTLLGQTSKTLPAPKLTGPANLIEVAVAASGLTGPRNTQLTLLSTVTDEFEAS